ncbi:DNA repair protein RadC [Stenotrophomonas maltophilia]|uniref:JAB domain-containing protein n=1 Tax=Stenotrophomonas maltophilia TaxID=40324 RepID=UPI001313264A|nr:DNA repair protein RadC [Stenotrophomonas maltophilia]MBA0335326.1 DNA repair protein RadC [Stenotrophomonas maltophilia]MBA0539303.1 DNA repair protein RadC [Stenotrophomonas maltophilia]
MKRANDIRAQYQLAMDEEGILLAASEILERRLQRQGAITDPSDAADFLKARCAGLPHEVFGVVFLDTRHRIIASEHLFQGTIDGCEVHPRIVAKKALDHNAAAVIFFHNHPSGNPEPSAADRALTARLKQSLALLDVRVLDHLVVAGTTHASMAARGWV